MWVVSVLVGVVLVAAVAYDIFHTLFHVAGGGGAISDWLSRGLWKIFRRLAHFRQGILNWAGGAIMFSVIAMWVSGLICGYAFIYWPELPNHFTFAEGLDPQRFHTYLDALNVSIGSLITLSGDIIPKDRWLRFVMGIEGLMGFGALTASVSWLLSVYPVLENRRAFSHALQLMLNEERKEGNRIEQMGSDEAQQHLSDIAKDLVLLRAELLHFPITFYFRESEHGGLAGVMLYIDQLATSNARRREPSVRLASQILEDALQSFLELIGKEFLGLKTRDKDTLMRALAHDHMRKLESRPHKAA